MKKGIIVCLEWMAKAGCWVAGMIYDIIGFAIIVAVPAIFFAVVHVFWWVAMLVRRKNPTFDQSPLPSAVNNCVDIFIAIPIFLFAF